jgi:hypothetical protein
MKYFCTLALTSKEDLWLYPSNLTQELVLKRQLLHKIKYCCASVIESPCISDSFGPTICQNFPLKLL